MRAIGASNLTAPRLAAALDVSRASACRATQTLQPHYNLYERASYEGELRSAVRAREHRRHHVLLARRRFPHRQVPHRGPFRARVRAVAACTSS